MSSSQMPRRSDFQTRRVEARAGGRERNEVEARAGGRERNEVEARAGGRERNEVEARAGGRERNEVEARAGGRERNEVEARAGGREANDDAERLLWRRAVRQSLTLRAASAAIAYAPTLDECAAAIERSKEELANLELTIERYRELGGGDLAREIEREVQETPPPSSWLEASVALLVLCLAAQLETGQQLRTPGPAQLGPRQLAEAAEHVGAARAALRESCEFSAEGTATAPRYIARWLKVALEALEDSAQSAYLAALRCDVASLGFAMDDSIVAA